MPDRNDHVGRVVLIDVQGTADLTNITFNGVTQVPARRLARRRRRIVQARRLEDLHHPTFKNQGQCVSYVASHGRKQHHK